MLLLDRPAEQTWSACTDLLHQGAACLFSMSVQHMYTACLHSMSVQHMWSSRVFAVFSYGDRLAPLDVVGVAKHISSMQAAQQVSRVTATSTSMCLSMQQQGRYTLAVTCICSGCEQEKQQPPSAVQSPEQCWPNGHRQHPWWHISKQCAG